MDAVHQVGSHRQLREVIQTYRAQTCLNIGQAILREQLLVTVQR